MYDANLAPGPAWLSWTPADKLRQVIAFHAAKQLASGPHKSHAALHVMVEDQLARGEGRVSRAMARLQQQGMTRHAALHAVGELQAAYRRRQMGAPDSDDAGAWHCRLNDALDALRAEPQRGGR